MADNASDLVQIETLDDGITMLRLNRPDRLNSIQVQLIDALWRRLDEVDADRECRVVILTGVGRAFCAGADLKGTDSSLPPPSFESQPGPVGNLRIQEQLSNTIRRLRMLSKPVIAAVNGPATGGGLALVLGSDIRLAAASARFSAASARIGLSGCEMGTGWILSRLVGAGRAHELMLTGRIINADEALRIGLVLDVVPDDALIARALETAKQIRANSPFGVYMTKQTMWSSLEIPGLDAAINLENHTQVMISGSEDMVEAMTAFVERRDPMWHDC